MVGLALVELPPPSPHYAHMTHSLLTKRDEQVSGNVPESEGAVCDLDLAILVLMWFLTLVMVDALVLTWVQVS